MNLLERQGAGNPLDPPDQIPHVVALPFDRVPQAFDGLFDLIRDQPGDVREVNHGRLGRGRGTRLPLHGERDEHMERPMVRPDVVPQQDQTGAEDRPETSAPERRRREPHVSTPHRAH